MTELFDPGTRFNRPDPETVAALVAFGLAEDKVKDWSTAHAKTTLQARRKEADVLARRQREQAREEKRAALPNPGRGQPTPMERAAAAEYLAECLAAGGPDRLSQALCYSLYVLTDDETRRLATWARDKLQPAARPPTPPSPETSSGSPATPAFGSSSTAAAG